MVRIEPSLARIQLVWAVLASAISVGITAWYMPQHLINLALGAGCVVATYALLWPIHWLATAGGKQSVLVEAVLIPIRLGILVALSLYAIDNVARPGVPFALGIAIPVVAGSLACLWACAKDPRYYWVTLAKPPVLRTRQTP